jgi:hypothetical protein
MRPVLEYEMMYAQFDNRVTLKDYASAHMIIIWNLFPCH